MTRKHFFTNQYRYTRLLPLLVLLLLLSTACVAPSSSESAPAVTEATASDPAFPVTIDHKYGSTTITEKPERIVTVGLTEQDALLALGIVPVGTTEWFGGYPGSIWPWAQDELQTLSGEIPQAVGGADGINFEAIAALNPDLILALYSGVTDEDYELLTQIAPTIAQPGDYVDYGIPWQELTTTVGRAVGQAAEAEAFVDAVKADLAQVQETYPEFVGATSVVATPYEGIFLYSAQDVRGRLLTSLGFILPDELAEIAGDSFGGNLSLERADLLDLDVIIWLAKPTAADEVGGPVYQSLSVHTEGREVFLSNDEPLGGATSFVTVLSLPYLLEGLVPQLADALGLEERPMADTSEVAQISLESDASAEASCKAGFRAIEGAFGATCIPATPQRIIAMNEGVMANLLALGITPIGVVDWANRDYTQYLGDTTQTIASVGTTDGPNYEAMILLNPDLILAMESDVDAETLPLLSQIAPVAVSPISSEDWRGNLLFTGEATAKTAEAEALVSISNVRLEEFRTAYANQAPADETIAIIRSRADAFNIYNKESFIAELSKEAGLRMPAAFDEIEVWNTMSMEAITLLTSDKLFVMVRNEREAGAFLDLAASPLWQTIPAVQQDEVHLVNWSVWVAGWNIIGANLVIDDLYFFMLGEESPTPNPLANLIIPDYGPLYDEERLGIEQ